MNFANGVGEAARLAEETQVFGVGVAQRHHVDELVEQMRGLNFRTPALVNWSPTCTRAWCI